MEGGHPKIGAELAKRYGETSKEVLHAIAGHHDDVTIDHVYTVLVAAADAISASRPGARRETLEKYVKRLEELEALAFWAFRCVDQAFAIQAGRELRVASSPMPMSCPTTKPPRRAGRSPRPSSNSSTAPARSRSQLVRETRTVRNLLGDPAFASERECGCKPRWGAFASRLTGNAMRLLFLGDIVGQPGVLSTWWCGR